MNAHLSLVVSNTKNAFALKRAEKHGIESIFVNPADYSEKRLLDKAIANKLKEMSIDLICLAGYMRLLGKEFIHTFSGKIINIHPSLLPAFPGLNAQKQAIEYGVKFSGCTVHFVDNEYDHGSVLLQRQVPVASNDSPETLAARVFLEECEALPEAINLLAKRQLTKQ